MNSQQGSPALSLRRFLFDTHSGFDLLLCGEETPYCILDIWFKDGNFRGTAEELSARFDSCMPEYIDEISKHLGLDREEFWEQYADALSKTDSADDFTGSKQPEPLEWHSDEISDCLPNGRISGSSSSTSSSPDESSQPFPPDSEYLDKHPEDYPDEFPIDD